MRIGNTEFDLHHHTYIMGILNVTPDSFSDGGRYTNLDAILFRTEQMIAEGADILDIGGESTRPGHTQISVQEELDRVVPAIEQISKRFDIPISIDTYKSEVASIALQAGASLVNDIWGLKYDPKMAEVIAKEEACCCLMHNRETRIETNFLQQVAQDLQESVELALQAGIGRDQIILDPGVGFAKSYEQNLQSIGDTYELHALGFPLLLGTSRKSVIGLTLDLPVEERVEGTLATTVFAVLQGCQFVRVHDIKENRRVIQMAEAIKAHMGGTAWMRFESKN
jgi:dihydropteroate synthase